MAHVLDKEFIPSSERPADLRAQLKEIKERDKRRACPNGKKCRVPCAAPHDVDGATTDDDE